MHCNELSYPAVELVLAPRFDLHSQKLSKNTKSTRKPMKEQRMLEPPVPSQSNQTQGEKKGLFGRAREGSREVMAKGREREEKVCVRDRDHGEKGEASRDQLEASLT